MPHPAGYERKGLMCGSTGDLVEISVHKLMANVSTMPAGKTRDPIAMTPLIQHLSDPA